MNNVFENMMKEWRTRLDEMKLQLSLGKMDAADAFEKQKEQLKTFVQDAKSQLDKGTELAEEHVKNLRSKLEELNLQLHLGKAETLETFEEQRKKIEPALQAVYDAGKNAYNKGYNQAMSLFDTQADWFKTNLEIMQLKFSLGKMEAREEAEELKRKLESKIEELSDHSRKWQEQTKENIEEWTEMAKDNMEKFRNWMKELGK